MSLKNRVKQIAQAAVKSYLSTQSTIIQNNVTNNCNLVGQVQSYDDVANLYTVMYTDGTTESVSPGGTRALGIGDAVLVSNGLIIG